MTPLPVRAHGPYLPRVWDAQLASRMAATGAVLIEGARGCGKTRTALQTAASSVRLDSDVNARQAALLDPSLLLEGDKPRLIDEWQLVPEIWNQVRVWVNDHPDKPGSFILTGSAVPADDETRNVGVLRFSRMQMRPMSLLESGHSTGDISLARLFAGEPERAADSGMDIRRLAERIAVGGWPGLIGRSPDEALVALRGYLDETRRVDLGRVDGSERDPGNVARVMRSLARHAATQASAQAIAADVGGPDEPVKRQTVSDYLQALTRVFVVEDQPAWSPVLRSRSQLRSAPKRHFIDPSLAVAALGTAPTQLLQQPEMLGQFFESLVVRDLRIYSELIDGSISHYRDNTGLEADAIISLRDGQWAAVEAKLGHREIDAAASALLRLAERIDVESHGHPAFLAVVTGWGYGYRREDGVMVVPIGSLGT